MGAYTVDPSLADRYPQFCFQRERGDDGGLYYGSLSSAAPRMDVRGSRPVSTGLQRTAGRRTQCHVQNRLDWSTTRQLFRELDGVQERVETVMSPYSMASDVNFVLDRLSPKLSLFAGGSGQAFKFAPLVGDSLARLACGESPAVDLSCWSHQREAVRA